MTLEILREKLNQPIFYDYQVERLFSGESKKQINVQLWRWVRSGRLVRLKRGIFKWPKARVGELFLAHILYQPSYISLETALSLYGIKPEIPSSITSISPITTKNIKLEQTVYAYSKINKNLFFGFESKIDSTSGLEYQQALPEKAVLDYVYIKRLNQLSDERLDLSLVKQKRLMEFATYFPSWVRVALSNEINN